jgi:hypothetical protein
MGKLQAGRALGTGATVSQTLMVSYLVTDLRVPPLLPHVTVRVTFPSYSRELTKCSGPGRKDT